MTIFIYLFTIDLCISELVAIFRKLLPLSLQDFNDAEKLADYLDKHPDHITNLKIKDEDGYMFLRRGIEMTHETLTYMFLTYLHKNNSNEVLAEGLNILREKQGDHHSEFSRCVIILLFYFAKADVCVLNYSYY